MTVYAATRFIATVPASHIALAHLHLSKSIFIPMYLPLRSWLHGFEPDNCDPKADEAEWEGFWRALSRVWVRDLLVEITLSHEVKVPEQVLLEPLWHIKAGTFEVVLPLMSGLEMGGEFEDAPFVVRRPLKPVEVSRLDVDKGGPGVQNGLSIWERLRKRGSSSK